MSIKHIIKKLIRWNRVSPEKAAMDYCFSHGFTAGKNFQYNSGYPIDANYPWLISVGDNVWIGGGVKVMPGVKIGSNVVIGGGSVVTRDIPPHSIAAGNPCRVIRQVTDKDRMER